MHPRRAILDAIKALYVAQSKFTRVLNTRIQPKLQSWPTVTFYDDDESVAPLDIHAFRDTERTLTLTTVIWTRASADPEAVESDLDYYCQLAETVFPFDMRDIGVIDIKLISTVKDAPEYDDNGTSIRIATASITHQITYIVCEQTS